MLLSSQKRPWKMVAVTLVAVLVVSLIAGCGKKNEASGNAAGGSDKGKVVATYKGGEITEKEFNTELKMMTLLYPQYEQIVTMDQFREYLLKQEIAYKILEGKATDAAKKEGKKKAEDQLKQMKEMGGDQFKQALDKQKLAEADVLGYMTRLLTVVEDFNAKVTDDQVKKQYETDKNDFTVASVRHILIGLKTADGKDRTKADALKIAKEVQAKLKKGEDFAKLAKEYSEDPGSKNDGGLYKDVEVTKWVAEFKKAAVELPLNTISDPVESEYGYHVMRVESRTTKTFEQLTADQKQILRGKVAGEGMNTFMEKELPGLITKIDLPKTEQPKTEEPKAGDKATTDKATGDKAKTETDKK